MVSTACSKLFLWSRPTPSTRAPIKANLIAPSSGVAQARSGLVQDKRVLVTAAAGTGIGYATAKRAMEEGGRVMIQITTRRQGHG